MKHLLLSIFLLGCFVVSSQSYIDKWEASYSASGTVQVVKTLADSDDNVYILANQINSGTSEVMLLKYDKNGNRDWVRTYSYDGTSEDFAVDMVSDNSSNIYVLISVNPDNAGNFSTNGYAIRKYSENGVLTNSYQSVGSYLGSVPSLLAYHASTNKIFVTSSRNASGGMGLNLALGRFTTSLTLEQQETYDSSEDDVAYAIDFSSTKANVYFTKGTNTMSLASIPKDFDASDDFTVGFSLQDGNGGLADHDISSTPFESLTLKEDITILKHATGTKLMYQRKAGNDFYITFRSFNSTYQIEDLYTHISNGTYPFNNVSLTVTGSKTANGEEQMFVLYLDNTATSGDVIPQWATEYEKSLNENHDGVMSRGLVATKNESYGRLVQRNSAVSRTYAGFATFENSNFQDVEYHSQSADFEASHLELLENGQIYVGTSGSTLELFAICNPPDITGLGSNQIAENGETVTLSINSQGSNSIEWSTGETDVTQISITGVSEIRNISVTVTDDSGCSSASEVAITFAKPAPDASKWLMPELLPVSGNGSPNMRLKWTNDDPLATSHVFNAYLYTSGTFDNNYAGNTVAGTTTDYELNGDEWRFEVVPKNDDDVSGPSTTLLTFRNCGFYDMSELGTYMAGLTLNGTTSVPETGGTASFNIGGFSSQDDELNSYFEWTLPSGWTITEYSKVFVDVAVASSASSGEVSVRIVNPCTGVATAALTKNVYVVKDQTITFDQPSDLQVGDDAIDLGATASSTLSVSYGLNNGNAELSGSQLTALHTGTVTITASQAGNAEYNAASSVERTISISKGDDLITFDALSDVDWDAANFDLDDGASSKSGRSITWSGSDPTIATVSSSGVVDLQKPGTITITASLSGNADWNAAQDVQQTLTALKTDQTITFDPLPVDKEEGDQDFNLSTYVSTTSGLALSYQSDDPSVVSLSGGTITVEGKGTATITASQAGNDYYNAANDMQQSITIAEGLYIWEGGLWNLGETSSPSLEPTTDDNVEIRQNYVFSTAGPFAAKNLTIKPSTAVNVDNESTLEVTGDLVNDGILNIFSGSSLITYSGNTIADNISFKRSTTGPERYSFVGTPINQIGSVTGSDLGTSIYRYDEAQPYGADGLLRWIGASSDVLVPGVGYTQFGQQFIDFVGRPNAGTILHAGKYTGTYNDGTNEATEGWNLVANPYPAAVKVSSFLAGNANIEGAVYLWDDNGSGSQRGTNSDYVIANGTVATNTTAEGGHTKYNQHIGSMQAFFVKLKNDSNTDIAFTETMRVAGNNEDDAFYREENPSFVRINLTDDLGLFKQTVVGWVSTVSDAEIDRSFDARVFNGDAPYAIYTFKNEQPLAIQGVANRNRDVELGFNVEEGGKYEIGIETADFNGISLYLVDKVTGVITDLLSSNYQFTTSAGQIADRFTLSENATVLGAKELTPFMYAYNNVLYLPKSESNQQLKIFNLSGVLMLDVQTDADQLDLNHFSPGIYIVSNGDKSQKISVK